jgi:addiction module HigA family antidote
MASSYYKVAGLDGKTIRNTEHPLHPGYVIAMEIDARELKKQDVARGLGIKPQHLSELMNEKRNVSAMLALKLESVFDIEADYWLRVQSGYDLVKARKKLYALNTVKKSTRQETIF